jgi:fructoselysine-6-P-deglycase FrlB-like protein
MGKRFVVELASLADTYRWAQSSPIDSLAGAVDALRGYPLLAAGSGGSFTAAHVAAELHRRATGTMAQAVTPQQLNSAAVFLRKVAVLLPTAGGKNPDVLGAFNYAVRREPGRLLVWCGRRGSPLARAAAQYRYVDVCDYDLPAGKDGFLAVNSLLAFSVLLARAYGKAAGGDVGLPPRFEELLADNRWTETEWLDSRCDRVWKKSNLVILHGRELTSVAVDLESKFTEAALGTVQTADFRHFAHGRHHWLAKRGEETAIVCLETADDKDSATRTLAVLPKGTTILRVPVCGTGITATLSGLVHGFHLVASVGRARGIDPGRPGVPPFGRRLYHLNLYPALNAATQDAADDRAAIERKAGRPLEILDSEGELGRWRAALANARRRVHAPRYSGLVLDYDGTLCRTEDRFGPLSREVAAQIVRLLRAGVVLGIASGRGKSVRTSLQQAIPQKYWARVIVGYYNGADVGPLGSDSLPDGSESAGQELQAVLDAFSRTGFGNEAEVTVRPRQITLTPRGHTSVDAIWCRVQPIVAAHATGASVFRSGHSVDVVAPGVSKLAVVDQVLASSEHPDGVVLRIGDRGRWPGNDFALLDSAFALSVDEASPDPEGAWNLAEAGLRGEQACLAYLRQLRASRGVFAFGKLSGR